MTNEVKSTIRRLRLAGENYAQIAKKLGVPEGTIKTFCSRNNLKTTDIKQIDTNNSGFCKQCGKPLNNVPKRKPKQFCSNECRLHWWNANRDKVNKNGVCRRTCLACGDEFESYGDDRKYCSHTCYISHRFGKARIENDTRAV